MSTVVGALEIQLMADVARLQRDMDSVKKSVDSTMRDVERMARGATAALGALGVGLSAVATVGFIKGVIEANAALDDMAEITGASVESLSALRQVARVSGEDMNTVAGAMTKLAKNLAGVDDESKGAGKALEALGLTVADIKNLKADEQLLTIAKAMGEFEDGSGKAAVAQALLGKTGAALIPYLKDLAEWGELNASVTAQQAAESEALQKGLARLGSDMTDVGAVLVGEMLPYLQLVTTEFRSAQQGANDFGASGGALKTIAETLIVLFSEVSFVFRGLGTEIGGIAAQIALVAQGEFAKAGEIGRMMKADAATAREEHDKFIASVMTLDKQLASPAVPEATKKTLEFSSAVTKAAKATKEVAVSTKDWHDAILQAYNDVIAWEESGKALEKIALDEARAWNALTESVEAHATALEAEVENYGKTEAQIQRAIVARLEEARALTDPAFAEHLAFLDREIAARERIIAAAGSKGALDANAAASRKAAEDWQKTADDINRSLTDAIMGGGKSGFELLQDYARTIVLRPLIQAALQPVTNAVGSMFGGSSSGGNLLSTGNSLAGLFGSGGAAAGTLTAANLAGAAGGDALGTLIAGNAGAWGVEAGAVGAGASAMGTIGAALPWVGGALAVASLLGAFGDDGPAQRSANFRSGLGYSTGVGPGESNNAIDATQWFSGTEMNASLNEFQKQVAAGEKRLIANLGLTSAQQSKASAALYGIGDRRYDFGTEHTDWRQSMADEQIVADRLQVISDTLGISIADLTAAMSESAESAADKAAKIRAAEEAAAAAEAKALAERAAELAKLSRAMDIELMQALGHTAEATAALRADALAALDESLRSKQQEIWAAQDAAAAIAAAQASAAAEHQALIARYDQERAALRSISQQMSGFAATLITFRASLGLPGSTGGASYEQARSNFASTGLAAMGADEAALGALPGTVTAFLGASQARARNRIELARDQATAYAVLDASIAASSGMAGAAARRAGADATSVAVDALRAELRAANVAMAAAQQETARILRRWEGGGMPETRVPA